MRSVTAEVRPVIKVLAKDICDRTKIDNELIVNYFRQLEFFKTLNVSTPELLKGINSITVLHLKRQSILFKYG